MLVVTRKQGESIQIGNDITVMVVSVSGGKVRIGIEAPKETKIIRTEIIPKQNEDNDETKRIIT